LTVVPACCHGTISCPGRGEKHFCPVSEHLTPVADKIAHPPHYLAHPSGVECIQITEHMNFCLGNAVKYIWRAGLKSDDPVEDLKKAIWYLNREIERLGKVK
jgi:hypothetical protein